MDRRAPLDVDLLLEQTAWVRAVAGRLVRDPVLADDIAQETLLAALEAPPRDVADAGRLRAWLGRVATNLSHLSTRRTIRRLAREERVARADREISTAEAVLREALRRRLAEAVDELEEPYRSTVELRYFEGVSTADIAERMGTTDNAVRKRLYRARRKLRTALEPAVAGERSGWLGAFLPWLAGLRRGGTRPAGGALAALGAAAAGVVALAILVVDGPDQRPPLAGPHEARALEVSALGAAPPAPAVRSLAASAEAARRLDEASLDRATDGPHLPPFEPATPRDAPEATSSPSQPVPVHGRVVDPSGRGLAGLPVVAAAGRPATGAPRVLGWSGRDGRFLAQVDLEAEAPGQPAVVELEIGDREHATLARARVEPWNTAREHRIVAARALSLAGRVVDELGTPLPDATVRLEVGEEALVALEHGVLDVHVPGSTARADDGGRFALERVPAAAGLWLVAEAPPDPVRPEQRRTLLPARLAVPAVDARDLLLVLRPPARVLSVAGVVRFEDGSPAGDTLVRLGRRTTRTDPGGRFRIEVGAHETMTRIEAERPGYRQVAFPDVASLLRHARASDSEETSVGIVLRESRDALAGRVVGPDGAGCAGWVVCARPSAVCEPGTLSETRTDESGAFALRGLVAGEHDVLAYDLRTLLSVRASAPAGERDLLLSVSGGVLPRRLGRVVDAAGAPIAGAEVRLGLALEPEPPGDGGGAGAGGLLVDTHETPHALGRAARSDALGWFVLQDVPELGAELLVRAEGATFHAPLEVGPGGRPAAPVEVRVPRRRAVRLSGAPPAASSIALLGADGSPLRFSTPDGRRTSCARLFGGASCLLGMHEDPGTVVYLDALGHELGRAPADGAPLRVSFE